jgi:hypothetical protein
MFRTRSSLARPFTIQRDLERVLGPPGLSHVFAARVVADDLDAGEAGTVEFLGRVPGGVALLALEEEGGGVVAAFDKKAASGARGAGLVPVAGQ